MYIKNSQSLFAGNIQGELTVFLLKKLISYSDWTTMRRGIKVLIKDKKNKSSVWLNP